MKEAGLANLLNVLLSLDLNRGHIMVGSDYLRGLCSSLDILDLIVTRVFLIEANQLKNMHFWKFPQNYFN